MIGSIEFGSEFQKPHYMSGGEMVTWDPMGLAASMTPEQLKVRQLKELKNGRLAMLGVISFPSAHNIPGSVPALMGASY